MEAIHATQNTLQYVTISYINSILSIVSRRSISAWRSFYGQCYWY